MGTKLSDDHPISFVYDSALAAKNPHLRSPAALPAALPLDHEGRLQCTTCHDPHNDSLGHFLRMDNRNSEMCISCHDIDGWASSSHAMSSSSVSGAQQDRWDNVMGRSVRELACEGCHRPHSAGGRRRLMRREAEEDNCLSCHDGSVAKGNLAAEFRKASSHPLDRTTGVHDPTEDARTMQEHVECSDCHDAHQSSGSNSAKAPFLKASMKGVSGLTNTGVPVSAATYEWEVCYKCHAKRDPVREPLVDRVIRNNNIAQQFALSNASFHPVEGVGKNQNVPSLLEPLRTTSIIYCTDCHGSDGNARGPHGSSYRPLLVRNYDFENPDSTSESPLAYSLCYGCHNRDSILKNRGFRYHRKHLDKKASCSACHAPHGVEQNAHLINFDRKVVFPSKKAKGDKGPIYVEMGFRRGSCTLLCHGKDHDGKRYHRR